MSLIAVKLYSKNYSLGSNLILIKMDVTKLRRGFGIQLFQSYYIAKENGVPHKNDGKNIMDSRPD